MHRKQMMKNNEPNMNISQGWRKPVFNYAECKNLNKVGRNDQQRKKG